MSQGDITQPEPRRELEALRARVAELETRAARAEQAEAALRKVHDELDARVRQRTAELAAANQRLRREVDERRQTETALRTAKEFTDNLIDSMQDGLSVLDPEGVHADVNPAFCRMTGFRREELIGVGPPYPYWPPEACEKVESAFRNTLGGRNGEFGLGLIRRDGCRFPVLASFSPVKDGHGTVVSCFVTIKDITERKRAEEALRESEQKYRELVDDSIDGIAIVQGNEIKLVNRQLLRMFGCQGKSEMEGQTFTRFIAPDFRRLMEERGRGREAGKHVPSRYEFKGLRKDGTEFDAELSVGLVAFEGGVARQAIVRDISERKRAEQALRESEARYRTLVERLPAIAYLAALNETSTTLYVSPQIEGLTGFSPEEYRADPEIWHKRLHPEDREHVLAQVRRSHATGEPLVSEYRMLTRDGNLVWLRDEAGLVHDETGRPLYLQGVMFDITERKRAEEALRRSKELFQAVFAGQLDAIFILDAERPPGIVDCNPATTGMFGYRREELLGQPTSLLHVSPESLKEFQDLICPAVENAGHVDSLEFRMKRKDGTVFFTEHSIVPLKDMHGVGTGWISIVRDISGRKRSEQHIRQHGTELAHVGRLSTLGEMASGIAHQLNQPLFAIMNYAEACKRSIEAGRTEPAEIVRDLQSVISEGQQAGEIIRRLRNFARKRQPRWSSVDLNELVREVLRFVKSEAHLGGIRVRAVLARSLPTVQGDAVLLQQVILNLLRNAIDALSDADEGRRELTVQTSTVEGNLIAVAVRDTGSGVTTADMNRLFEPFFTTKPEGLGLGLSISRSIIEADGGQLTAVRNPDRGMTFRFTLPVSE